MNLTYKSPLSISQTSLRDSWQPCLKLFISFLNLAVYCFGKNFVKNFFFHLFQVVTSSEEMFLSHCEAFFPKEKENRIILMVSSRTPFIFKVLQNLSKRLRWSRGSPLAWKSIAGWVLHHSDHTWLYLKVVVRDMRRTNPKLNPSCVWLIKCSNGSKFILSLSLKFRWSFLLQPYTMNLLSRRSIVPLR